MMRHALSGMTGMLCLWVSVGNAMAADTPPGKAIFDRDCAPCHAAGPGHAGTMRLAEIRGPAKAALEQRTDLDPAYIRLVVRQGLVEMPPWRLSELDDAALAQLVQYLTRGHK
jgi:mono/diheme cytochrome c family protein